MANVTITSLPTAGPITGTESVPIVQNGQTVQTTTAAIAASPSQTQTFLTINSEATLPNSRYLSTSTGLGLTDGGALSFYRLSLNRASGSLETALTGIVAKDTASTVVARTLQTSGSGLSVSNGDGVSGNPTFSLAGQVLSLANASGTGFVALPNNGSVVIRTITGTANQITVSNGSGASGDPTLSLVDNTVMPGTGGMVVPIGTSAQQPVGTQGQFRFNSSTQTFDGYSSGQWRTFSQAGITSFSAGSTGFSPSTPTTGAIVLTGALNAVSGGTGQTSYTAGDLLYASTISALSKLSLGTQGYFLKAGASGPEWSVISGGTF
jgi:hypothetical protein